MLSLQTVPTREPPLTPVRCVNEQGFSLHAEVCWAAHERHKLEHLCRYITGPAIANERLTLNRAGDVVLQLKSPSGRLGPMNRPKNPDPGPTARVLSRQIRNVRWLGKIEMSGGYGPDT